MTVAVAEDQSVSRGQLRAFQFTGRGLDAFAPRGELRPALLDEIELPPMERSYPIYIAAGEAARPWFEVLQTAIAADPSRFPILRDRVETVVAAFGEEIGSRLCVSVASLLDAAFVAVERGLDAAVVDAASAHKECEALRKAMPRQGWLIAFGNGALPLLHCAILHGARGAARRAFTQELKEDGERLRETLDADERNSAAALSSQRISESLGARAASFLDPTVLAESLRRRVNPVRPMNAERRARCESALATIDDAITQLKRMPSVVLVHSGPAPEIPRDFAVRFEPAGDVCAHALALCRRQLESFVPVWKALRIARLEAQSAFDATTHAEALDSFAWPMAHAVELAALPAVMAFGAAPQIEDSLSSFAKLMNSGLPVQVAIACQEAAADNLGCLPLGYHEAFALHSSLASAAHLTGGLAEMAQTLRPAAAAVAAADASWEAASLVQLAGAFPLYRFNPDRGESWFDRFALQTDGRRDERLSLIHAAALIPAFRSAFRVLPGAADPTEQVCSSFAVKDGSGKPAHAVWTRELDSLSAMAQQRRRLLAELATPKTAITVDADAQNQARLAGATEAIERVISILRG